MINTHTRYLFNFFLKFFVSKVFNNGLLKDKFFRYVLLSFVIIIYVTFSVLIYLFFKRINTEHGEVELLINIYSSTLFLWTLIIYLFMKLVFQKSGGMLEYTTNFPITLKDKKISLLMFELMISLSFILLLSSSVVTSLVFKFGITYLARLIVVILFQSITIILILTLITRTIEYLVSKLNMISLSSFFQSAIIMFIFIYFYLQTDSTVRSFIFAYQAQSDMPLTLVSIWSYLYNIMPFYLILILFLSINTILFLLNTLIPISTTKITKFYKVYIPKVNINIFTSYIYSSLRRLDNYNTLLICFLIEIGIIYSGNESYLLYSLIPISYNAIYAFVDTNSIRRIYYTTNYNQIRDYLLMILAHFVLASLITSPILISSLVIGVDLFTIFIVYMTLLIMIMTFVMSGILFPPYNDNPFSVITSTTIIIILSVIFLGVMLFAQANDVVIFISTVILTILSILVSIVGLNKIRENIRYEKDSNVVA